MEADIIKQANKDMDINVNSDDEHVDSCEMVRERRFFCFLTKILIG
jgi:hypothetical protein